MTAKIIGAVIIEAACGFSGFYASERLKKRHKYLGNIISALSLLETEINFGANKLKKAFAAIDEMTDTCGLFSAAAGTLERDGIRRAWSDAVNEKRRDMCLTDGDAEILELFGGRLGMTDTENQLKNIGHTKELLKVLEEKAAEDYSRSGKLYRSGGVLVGLFLILMLI